MTCCYSTRVFPKELKREIDSYCELYGIRLTPFILRAIEAGKAKVLKELEKQYGKPQSLGTMIPLNLEPVFDPEHIRENLIRGM